MSFLCSSACSRAAWSFRGNSDASSSIYRQLKVLQLLQMNNSGVETMHDCLIFGIRNVSIFLLDLIQSGFFLVCLFLSLTHDSSYLLTWVSYCCVRTLLRHFAVTDVSPQLHVATENQDTQEWSLRFLLVFFLYFFTVVLHSSLSSCLPRKVCSMSLFPSLPVILLLFFFLMWLYFYFLPLFFSHPHCCQM